ncbi:hypothetical protein L842_6148 [Mycobacterium intracellulare MIN_052511_1280]|nr:hypothetical protein L842_6054 [Mycobacterium intracellulare MIN_052511_1280]ETZ38140.1 hypothetical protein L842_6148 [Mycobacterium intracellulare MIN_052511_1280]
MAVDAFTAVLACSSADPIVVICDAAAVTDSGVAKRKDMGILV